MEFFNKKEEVIDLQLTQYGKYLLSLGKFKPVFYAFYDDGVIYDSQYMGFSENQNNSHPRIQEDTPNLKTLHNFHSIEDDMQRAVDVTYHMSMGGGATTAEAMESLQKILQQTPEKAQILVNPLANSQLATDKAPSWNVSALSGRILTGSTTSTLTLSSSATVLNIPQIEVEVKYSPKVKLATNYTEEQFANEEIKPLSTLVLDDDDGVIDTNYALEFLDVRVFDDGTYISIDKDDLILQILEENVPQGNDNFEIEFFSIEDVRTNNKVKNATLVEQLNQLRLLVEPDLVVNDILLDEVEGNTLEPSQIDSSFADYYFDIELDDEIDAATMCELIKNGDKDLYKFARKDFDCEENQQQFQFNTPYAQKQSTDECEDNS